MTGRALEVRAELEAFERVTYVRGGPLDDLMLGLVGDDGDLAQLDQAREGVRRVEHASLGSSTSSLPSWCRSSS